MHCSFLFLKSERPFLFFCFWWLFGYFFFFFLSRGAVGGFHLLSFFRSSLSFLLFLYTVMCLFSCGHTLALVQFFFFCFFLCMCMCVCFHVSRKRNPSFFFLAFAPRRHLSTCLYLSLSVSCSLFLFVLFLLFFFLGCLEYCSFHPVNQFLSLAAFFFFFSPRFVS